MTSAISDKILDHGVRVFADITKIDFLSALAEEQKPVKHLEQIRGGLVYSVVSSVSIDKIIGIVNVLTCKGWLDLDQRDSSKMS